MKLSSVEDTSLNSIIDNHYDLAFFSCGYEQRANVISKLLNRDKLKTIITFYFKEQKNIGNKKQNS